jgi:hypothetical protein
MNVFVNDAPSPTLEVGRLEGDAMKGGLRLQGPGTFANLVITPGAVEGLSPEPAGDPLDGDRGLVRNWRLSTFSALSNGKDPMYDEMPGASQEWKAISTERNGLLNLSREYGLPVDKPNRAVAWLKTAITSNRKQTKKVDIGWTREVWVFVNGQLVYADKNLFDQEGSRKFPDGRCSLENGAITLPLEAGDNEVAVALANNFFGWGLMLRLADPEGVHLAVDGHDGVTAKDSPEGLIKTLSLHPHVADPILPRTTSCAAKVALTLSSENREPLTSGCAGSIWTYKSPPTGR